jgi:thiol-disulfide isomerase/thioredoxin
MFNSKYSKRIVMRKLTTLLIQAAAAIVCLTSPVSAEWETIYKYTPLVTGEDMMIILPYASETKYVPPANSIDHTTVTTVDGKQIRVDLTPDGLIFEGHENKIVIAEVFGYTCPHCLNSIPGFNNLDAKYPDDVFIIAFENYGLDNAGLQQFVREHAITYTVVSKEDAGKIISFIQQLTGPILGVPWTLVMQQDGTVVDTHLGDLDEAATDALIQSLLQ